MKPRLLVVLFGLAAAVSVGITHAADKPKTQLEHTFNVPLQITNVPIQVNQYKVTCRVNYPGWGEGTGNTVGTVQGGQAKANVVVFVRVSGYGVPPAGVAPTYACFLDLTAGANNVPYLSGSKSGVKRSDGRDILPNAGAQFPLSPGAPFTVINSGTIKR